MRKALYWLDRLLAWFVAALVAGLVAIVTSQLVDRHFIDITPKAGKVSR